jgi:hypothetical protein
LSTLEIPPEALGLGASLAIGLLIGLERGWHDRELPEGGRVAGLRTFALTGLLGGVLGNLLPDFGPGPLLGGVPGISLQRAKATIVWTTGGTQLGLLAGGLSLALIVYF